MADKERESVYAYGSMQDNRNERRADNEQKRPQQTISDIIRGMQYAVICAAARRTGSVCAGDNAHAERGACDRRT